VQLARLAAAVYFYFRREDYIGAGTGPAGPAMAGLFSAEVET